MAPSTNTVDGWLDKVRKCEHLSESELKQLCDLVREILMEESNVQPVSSPVIVCGDVHGQFFDVLELFKQGGKSPPGYSIQQRRLIGEVPVGCHSGHTRLLRQAAYRKRLGSVTLNRLKGQLDKLLAQVAMMIGAAFRC